MVSTRCPAHHRQWTPRLGPDLPHHGGPTLRGRDPPTPATTTGATPHPVQPRTMPTDAAQRFVDEVGRTDLNPSPPIPSPRPAPRPPAVSSPPVTERPSGVLTAVVMFGINALVLSVLTLIGIAGAVDPGWGGVALTGVWGTLSVVGVLGLAVRSRPVFALVVLVQGIAAVFLALRVFTVVVHTPQLLVIYALTLLCTLTIGGCCPCRPLSAPTSAWVDPGVLTPDDLATGSQESALLATGDKITGGGGERRYGAEAIQKTGSRP